ncbi:MAG: hypothetical protein GQ542_00970 [Desulforhopalus sp.]|nr:hypothetical protein [Desulforhopalus sp.]
MQLFKEASALDHTIQEQLEVTLMSALLMCHHRPRVDPPSGEKLTHLTDGE